MKGVFVRSHSHQQQPHQHGTSQPASQPASQPNLFSMSSTQLASYYPLQTSHEQVQPKEIIFSRFSKSQNKLMVSLLPSSYVENSSMD
jgi:hypothetical protein